MRAMRVAAGSSEIITFSVMAPHHVFPGPMSSRRAASSATGYRVTADPASGVLGWPLAAM